MTITAMVAGYEAAASACRWVAPCWHPGDTGRWALPRRQVIWADALQMVHAIGRQVHSSGSVRPVLLDGQAPAADAAQSGTLSAPSPRTDSRHPRPAREHLRRIPLDVLPSSDPSVILDGLARNGNLLCGFKPYSTNGSCHPSIDALLEMRNAYAITADDVEDVVIHCSTATPSVGWPYEPQSARPRR